LSAAGWGIGTPRWIGLRIGKRSGKERGAFQCAGADGNMFEEGLGALRGSGAGDECPLRWSMGGSAAERWDDQMPAQYFFKGTRKGTGKRRQRVHLITTKQGQQKRIAEQLSFSLMGGH